MKNKKVKQMMFSIMSEKLDCKSDDFWFDGKNLMQYHPPHGFMEGDELPFWWHWSEEPFISLTGDQLRGVK